MSGSVPHPRGQVDLRVDRKGATVEVSVTLPPNTNGELRWKGTKTELTAGTKRFTLPA